MGQEQLRVFIDSIMAYFNKLTGVSLEVGVPFLKDDDQNILMQYTGAIGISGKMKGAVYITAEEKFLSGLISHIMPGMVIQEKRLESMVGELTNTIAGNAQRIFGKDFMISIPLILTSPDSPNSSKLDLKVPTFVIPLRWKDSKAFLVVGLEI